MKRHKVLIISSILMMIDGIIAVVAGVIAILDISAIAVIWGSVRGLGMFYASSILVTVASVIQFIAGIKGIGARSDLQKAASCVKWGIVIVALNIITIIMAIVSGGEFSVTNIILDLLLPPDLPGLYTYDTVRTITIILSFVAGGEFSITSLIYNLLLPGLYIYSAIQIKDSI